MEQKDEIQDIKLESLKEFLNLKFETVGKDIASLNGKYVEFERKNCDKHTVIQDLLSCYRGEIGTKMDEMKDRMFTKEQYDQFLQSNNGKLRMIDDRITKTEKKIDKVWQYLTIAGAILLAMWQFGQSIILEIFKKKI